MLDVAEILGFAPAQIELPDVRVFLQCLGTVVHHDAAAFDQIAVGDDFERGDRVLLDEQDREPFIAVDAAEIWKISATRNGASPRLGSSSIR